MVKMIGITQVLCRENKPFIPTVIAKPVRVVDGPLQGPSTLFPAGGVRVVADGQQHPIMAAHGGVCWRCVGAFRFILLYGCLLGRHPIAPGKRWTGLGSKRLRFGLPILYTVP